MFGNDKKISNDNNNNKCILVYQVKGKNGSTGPTGATGAVGGIGPTGATNPVKSRN